MSCILFGNPEVCGEGYGHLPKGKNLKEKVGKK